MHWRTAGSVRLPSLQRIPTSRSVLPDSGIGIAPALARRPSAPGLHTPATRSSIRSPNASGSLDWRIGLTSTASVRRLGSICRVKLRESSPPTRGSRTRSASRCSKAKRYRPGSGRATMSRHPCRCSTPTAPWRTAASCFSRRWCGRSSARTGRWSDPSSRS